MAKKRKAARVPDCYLCKKPAKKEDHCFGCDEVICANCDRSVNTPMGNHLPEAHRAS